MAGGSWREPQVAWDMRMMLMTWEFGKGLVRSEDLVSGLCGYLGESCPWRVGPLGNFVGWNCLTA